MFSYVCFVTFLARKEQNLLAVANIEFLVLVLCYFESREIANMFAVRC